ncbi:hypothetical protein [Dokdonella koreensis]|uniref:Peptidase C-terminal archaeal/bacterial domain-containing protein n=1 Tax=Dokdonella koreensis DS-123 TaxID=1300342 RepID=A0A160DVA5_9GAMM|nr:hypothetical protein [Dokdonella koreensis]ANB18465.1 Hypothetical protein I596_2457 [Dokdonella koreensis DS-123]
MSPVSRLRSASCFAFALAAAASAPALQAQTCGLPLPITIPDPSTPYVHSGNTCLAGNVVSLVEGIALPQRDIVYQFRTGGGGSITASFTAAGFAAEMLLVKGDPANGTSTIVDVGSAAVPMTTGPLADGVYTLIVTGDPSWPTPICGTYTLQVGGTLTVPDPNC